MITFYKTLLYIQAELTGVPRFQKIMVLALRQSLALLSLQKKSQIAEASCTRFDFPSVVDREPWCRLNVALARRSCPRDCQL